MGKDLWWSLYARRSLLNQLSSDQRAEKYSGKQESAEDTWGSAVDWNLHVRKCPGSVLPPRRANTKNIPAPHPALQNSRSQGLRTARPSLERGEGAEVSVLPSQPAERMAPWV